MRLRISESADRDLEKIYTYWAGRVSNAIANRVIHDIVDRFRLLGEFPVAGKSADHLAAGVRCFPAGKYLIYYRTRQGFTDILHIFHGAREQRRAFRTRSKG